VAIRKDPAQTNGTATAAVEMKGEHNDEDVRECFPWGQGGNGFGFGPQPPAQDVPAGTDLFDYGLSHSTLSVQPESNVLDPRPSALLDACSAPGGLPTCATLRRFSTRGTHRTPRKGGPEGGTIGAVAEP
jgi:hypothetical protein